MKCFFRKKIRLDLVRYCYDKDGCVYFIWIIDGG